MAPAGPVPPGETHPPPSAPAGPDELILTANVHEPAARRYSFELAMQALSGNPVYTDMWDARIRDNMPHIELIH